MRTRLFAAVSVAVVALAMLVMASGAAADNGKSPSAQLSGANEVPGPGDRDGSGLAQITLDQGHRTICFQLSYEKLGIVTVAHIHAGPAGVAGPIVVPLPIDAPDVLSGCVANVDKDLIKDIRKNPANYYVNIHTVGFPAGSIRGQLG